MSEPRVAYAMDFREKLEELKDACETELTSTADYVSVLEDIRYLEGQLAVLCGKIQAVEEVEDAIARRILKERL